MLAALGGCEPQVKGHVAANLKVGNDRARLIDVAHPAPAVHRLPAHAQRAQAYLDEFVSALNRRRPP